MEKELPTKFCSIPLFKPRVNRVDLLTVLDQNGILQHTDWSLAYNLLKHNYGNTVRVKVREPYTDAHRQFLEKYDFPKFIEGPMEHWQD